MPTIQHRRGTAAEWTTADRTLASGEIGVEVDTGLIKVGDGLTAWTDLAYANDTSDLATATALTTGLAAKADVDETVAELAAKADQVEVDRAFTERSLYIPATAFFIGQAAPVLGLASARWPAWTLRDAVTDRINTSFMRQPWATRVDVDVLWSNVSATTGNVAFRLHYSVQTVGDGTAILSLPITTEKADAFAYEERRTRVAHGIDLSTALAPLLMFERVGSDPSDTLTNSVAVKGLIITPAATEPALTDDGGWCWFNEPRLLADDEMIYGAYVTHDGGIGVSSLNTDTGATVGFLLHAQFEKDDHDTPGLLVRDDGRVMAFYSRHSIIDDPIYLRVTTNPHDVSAWNAAVEIDLPSGGQPCYPKPVQIGDRIYVFFRNALYQDFIYSDDDGATWSTPSTLFEWGSGWRGYVNMVVNGDRVDFSCNDDNPNSSANCNLYHCYLQGGNLYKTDGTLIEALGAGGITTSQMTKVYDYTVDGEAWGWDLQLDDDGRPVIVFATFPTTADHHYRYARWTGTAWVTSLICAAGPAIADRGSEPRYSGGIALLSSDTSVVYTSRKIGPTWEIERFTTADQGATWESTPVTLRSTEKQVRPGTPEGHAPGTPEVFWMSGWFVTYKHYGTRLLYA